MNLTPISISPRTCTEVESQALSLWSASSLPLCRIWAAKRGLQPPTEIIEALQKVRFDAPSIPETALQPLTTASPNTGQNEFNSHYDRKLEGIATDLAHDLRHFQVLASHSDPHDREQSFLTESRALRRFQRTMSQLRLTRVEIAASEPIIVTLFSTQRVTLYIPRWLLDVVPRTLFEPNQSFYRARPASLIWLFLDAIVVTATNDFTTV